MNKMLMRKLRMGRLPLAAKPNAGFTMIELLVAVVIAGALAAIAAPSFLAVMNNRRANTIQDQVTTAMRTAQTESLRTRQPHTVCLYPNATPLPVVTVERGYLPTCPAADASAENQLGYGEIAADVVAMTAPVTVVNFTETGALDDRNEANLPMTVTLEANGVERCVTVQTLLGSISTAKGGEPGCPP